MKTLRTIAEFWAPAALWFLAIHNLSAIPAKDLPHIALPHADKIIHAVEYFVLGALLLRAFDRSGFKVGLAKLALLAIIISFCYGALDELYQRSVPGRMCDPFDLLADCVGSVTGISFYVNDKRRRG